MIWFFLCKISPPPAVKLRTAESTHSENTHSKWKDELFTDLSAFLSGTLLHLKLTSSSDTIWLSHINTVESPTAEPHVSDVHTKTHRDRRAHLSHAIAAGCVLKRRIKMPIQHKIPPTHTYSAHIDTCTHMHIGVHMHTHSSTALLREVNSRLTSSCIMWVECSTEVAKWIVTVTMLKWGGITRVSSDLEVKAICDTIDNCLCSIEDLFDEIMAENALNVEHWCWLKGNSE